MLKKIVNEAYFTLRITTTGPLLVKSGQATVSGPDMTPVLTFRNSKQEVFIPGSSLKGVFRSHIEKVICSLRSHVACYPFTSSEDTAADIELRYRDYRKSCSTMFTERSKDNQRNDSTETVYRDSCPVCRLFGSTGFIGRVAIGDAFLVAGQVKEDDPDQRGIKEQRDGVGIDRLTGGASHGAKFELEVVSTGVAFETDIHLRNFEMWQLGMLFVVLQDMEDELIRIGSGRSRGLGKIKAELSGEFKGIATYSIRHGESSNDEPADELWGLGRWLDDGSYGTQKNDLVKLSPPVAKSDRGIRKTRIFTGENLDNLRDAAIQQFIDRINGWEQVIPVATPTRRR
ncbi:MAG TPA: CRISPR-associated RAMP protein Csx7 [Ktedonobacteraceae bacterium]|nr:CRISPR-associated RAMP protein Csx7 [Ktedonobacteraceae bacterium]